MCLTVKTVCTSSACDLIIIINFQNLIHRFEYIFQLHLKEEAITDRI